MSSSSSPFPEFSSSPESISEAGFASGDATFAEPNTARKASTDATQNAPTFDTATDGLTNRIFRSKSKGPIAAIFIHAGAGYHSTINEHVHLEACSDAANMAMKFLKAGGTAVDAVEVAIKCLEDKEITNAGFGSNLSIDGVVEGDATIVDHLGRSGACGSVQLIKNPISLARLIYEKSNIPLTLRRIPPNILVGHGAARFAQEHGMALVPHEHLISKGAHDRFCRWCHDLAVADQEAKANQQNSAAAASAKAVLKAAGVMAPAASSAAAAAAPAAAANPPPRTDTPSNKNGADNSTSGTSAPQPKRMRLGDHKPFTGDGDASARRKQNGSGDGSYAAGGRASAEGAGLNDNDTDIITDTVGAIAIDLRGNIAAGSSSGGIGMKHSGRVGPAALVGIGSAVIPANPKDRSGTSVAAVTSGTGEHMATTMASHTCCERLYHNQRRVEGGSFELEYDDDAIMKSFVTEDFMNHPGVKNQVSGGAIGVLAAKKTNKGIYFYFAHNTDSFALASMSSNDPEPLVVLSRLGARENVARGGRKIKPN